RTSDSPPRDRSASGRDDEVRPKMDPATEDAQEKCRERLDPPPLPHIRLSDLREEFVGERARVRGPELMHEPAYVAKESRCRFADAIPVPARPGPRPPGVGNLADAPTRSKDRGSRRPAVRDAQCGRDRRARL